MKVFFYKLSILPILLIADSTRAASSDFCPGTVCKQVWAMDAKATPLPSDHGSSWIVCDSSGYKYDGDNGFLTVLITTI